MAGDQITMDEHSDEMSQEKLSNSTIGARKLLLGTALFGFLVAVMPLAVEKVSVFGISLQIGMAELSAIVSIVLIYLAAGFIVRSFTDLAGATPSPTEKRLRERIASQTQDIQKRTMGRLANLLPSGTEREFHSDSFESLLKDSVTKPQKYEDAMMDNALNEIRSWKEEVFIWTAKENPDNDQEVVPPKEIISDKYKPILNELLDSHRKACRWRRLRNRPRWFVYWTFLFLRYYFFDAFAPSLFSLLVIALLVGGIDETWPLNILRWVGS